MRFVAIFEDTSGMPEIRSEMEVLHLDYLRVNAEEILIGGGLREEQGAPYVGGLWVMEVVSKARAIECDPYFMAEPRPYRLLFWGKAIPEARVVL